MISSTDDPTFLPRTKYNPCDDQGPKRDRGDTEKESESKGFIPTRFGGLQ